MKKGKKNTHNGQWGKKKVRWMEKEFMDKIEGLKSLALLAKETQKNYPTNDGFIVML